MIKSVLLDFVTVNLLLSIFDFFILTIAEGRFLIMALANVIFLLLWYFVIQRKKPVTEKLLGFYLIFTAAVFLLFTLIMKLEGGMLNSTGTLLMLVPLFPFIPFILGILFLPETAVPLIGSVLILHCLIIFIKLKGKQLKLLSMLSLLIVAVSSFVSYSSYLNRDELKYAGHGFQFMNGYSSTDFSDYHVYSDPGKLVTLDHEPEIIIENEQDMPVMDGAEACYPVYSAVAKAIYKDIAEIERKYSSSPKNYYNGKIVSFTNTVNGYYRLTDGDCDLLFGARPSQQQIDYAKENNAEFNLTQIGKEAFVFFVEKDNPVSNLTSDQLRDIYSGKITNWNQVGGPNQKIVAFQRPEGSGSQTMMQYFMKDVPLKEPKTYETFSSMDGIVSHVANYYNEDGAIGYSFRYFIEGLMQETNVKILSVDGIYPTTESIKNGSYPLTTGLYCVSRNEDDPNVQKVLDFLLSEDGQYIIEKTGYAGISN